MKKPVIAVDIDEVLFPFTREFIKFHNSMYEPKVSVEDFFTYEFEHAIGISVEEAVSRLRAFDDLEENLHIEPLQDAKDAIKSLAEKYELVIITARNPNFDTATRAWVQKHFGGMFSEVLMVGHPSAVENYRSKAEVCKEMNAIAMVDDSVDHIKKCVDNGITGILFGDYPWSRADELPEGAVRCEDWQSVLEYFDGKTK